MKSIFLTLLSSPFMFFSFVIVTWFWWKISRRFFTFLFNFSEDRLEHKNGSLQKLLLNYGIFGPLGLLSISGYIYFLLILFKNLD